MLLVGSSTGKPSAPNHEKQVDDLPMVIYFFGAASKKRRIRLVNFSMSRSWHSHTTRERQPICRSRARVRLSP